MELQKIKKISTGNIKHIIGIHSGKGGVGKTMVTVNLAAFFARTKSVGLLDADIDCPDIGRALGIEEQAKIENDMIAPILKHKMKIISSAFIQDPEKPMILRGPMKHHVLMQLVEKTRFGDIDYLFIDLPPGTSDVPLSTMEYIRPNMIFVTMPTETALMDTAKSVRMAERLGVNIIGVIENMSGELFGKNKTEKLAKKLSVHYLGTIEMNKKIAELSDEGMLAIEDKKIEKVFGDIAGKIVGFFNNK